MKNKFFGSKLNSILLLVLIILMVIALFIMSKNKDLYFSALGIKKEVSTVESLKLKIANDDGYTQSIIDGVWIWWGGRQSSCVENEFGKFVYGESTTTCLRGLRAEISYQPSHVLTQEDKNIFGDFVNDNK